MARPSALVTGGANGIGRATSKLFAERGHTVHVVDIDRVAGEELVREIVAAGGTALLHIADLQDDAAVQAAVAAIVEASSGSVEVVVNNAFTYERVDDMTTLTSADWQSYLQMLLLSYAAVVREVVPSLHPGAAIVNLASVRGRFTGPGFGPYAVAKAAVVQLTRSLAYELGPRGVRVNAVAPGIVATARTQSLAVEIRHRHEGITPLGRQGSPEDIARAVYFLASPEASFITGAVLVVDGGLTLPLQVDSVNVAMQEDGGGHNPR